MSVAGRDRPLVVGLTGPIAAGKSHVASILADLGAEVIDADAVYREMIAPPSPLLDRIALRFGDDILDPSGALDRTALGKIVFANPAELAALEAITHPAVTTEVRDRIARSHARVVVNEAIRLIESGMVDDVDSLWWVDADPEIRLQRLMARNSLDEESARVRLAASRPALPEGLVIDERINNSGSLNETRAAVQRAWQRLQLKHDRGTSKERTQREHARNN